MYTYCLFCETGKCDYVVRIAMQVYSCRAVSPKQIQHTWNKGRYIDREHDLLPGYVFLYSEEPIPLPQEIRLRLDRIIRSLRTTDYEYQLHGADEQFAMMLYRKNGVVGKTEVTEENGRFTVCDETFRDVPVEIQKVDRRNERMKIEMRIAGRIVQTWVQYNIVEPTKNETDITMN